MKNTAGKVEHGRVSVTNCRSVSLWSNRLPSLSVVRRRQTAAKARVVRRDQMSFRLPVKYMATANLPVAYTVLEVLVGVTAIVGNLVVIVIFGAERRLRRLTNLYIMSLAVSDLLVGLLGIPSAILTRAGYPKNTYSGCLAMLTLLVVLCTVSILNLLAVSFDRYWAILHPMAYHRLMSGRAAAAIIVGCWILGAVIGFLPLMGWNNGLVKDGCLFIPVMTYNYLVFLYFATIVYPCLLMAVFYGRIYAVVLKQVRQIAQLQHRQQQSPANGNHHALTTACNGNNGTVVAPSPPPSPVRTTSRREVKSAKSLFIIVLVFMICWVPLYTQNCVHAFCQTCHVPHWLVDGFIVLSHANSAINPFLYAYHLRDFRQAFRRLILRWKPEPGALEMASVAGRLPPPAPRRPLKRDPSVPGSPDQPLCRSRGDGEESSPAPETNSTRANGKTSTDVT